MKIILAILTIVGLSLIPMSIKAEGVEFKSTDVGSIGGCTEEAQNSVVCKDINSDKNPIYGPDGVLTTAARFFAIAVGFASVIMLILSGLRYVNSGGDPSKTATARNGIIYACIGISIAVLAQTIVIFILSRL